MATRKQAEARLKALGFEIDWNVSGKSPTLGWHVTMDAIGRNTVDGECRGQTVWDYTAPAAEFWAEVIREAEGLPAPTPCPFPPGECEFHDSEDES